MILFIRRLHEIKKLLIAKNRILMRAIPVVFDEQLLIKTIKTVLLKIH